MFNTVYQSDLIQNTLIPVDDPFNIAFYMGDFGVRWYAIFFILGFFVSIVIGCLTCHYRYKVKYDALFWFSIILIPVSILGARFWSACIGDLQWENFFNFHSGGLAIQGGVIFVVIAGFIYFPIVLSKPQFYLRVEEMGEVYVRKSSIWVMIDLIVPLVLLGQAIGRWGNFFNGEIFGAQTTAEDLTWLRNIMPGVFDHMRAVAPTTPGQVLSPLLTAGAYYQPLFLYEFFINILCFIVIYFLMPLFPKVRIGVTGSSYFIIYGVTRLIMESFRFEAYAFRGTYVINSLLIIAGVISLIFAQFICPRVRNQQVWYRVYICYVRYPLIKVGVMFKWDWTNKYFYDDPKLEKYGFKKLPDFLRKPESMLYYANR